jgi:hypothetical protein
MDNRLLIENLATIAAITLLLGSVALGPLGRALARRIEGRRADANDAALRDALAETEQRVAELETRLDFAERMLSQPAAERAIVPEQR